MNGEDRGSPLHNPDTSPFSDPQSPSLPHLHGHPTTDDHDDGTHAAGLRRRHHGEENVGLSPSGDGDALPSSSMRIHIQTPFSDLGEMRRKEVVVDRSLSVGEMKNGLASGQWGDEGWIRDGMRLVWRGRIVRDEEKLGDVVRSATEATHTFHLVARRSVSPSARSSRRVDERLTARIPMPEPAPVSTNPITSNEALEPPRDMVSIALQDSLHYLFFIARHHLCLLLGSQPLAWGETIPPPVIDQSAAEQAVKSVIKGVAQSRDTREEGWDQWEQAFGGADLVSVENRAQFQSQVRALWASTVGRAWSDDGHGNTVTVELDEIAYTLHLPPIGTMSDAILGHLLMYLRITSLIPLLIPIVEHETHRPPPSLAIPSPTRLIPPPQRQDRVRVLMRLRIPLIPVSVLQHMAYSALKIGAILWMLCRDMKWGDVRFWILAGAAAGWWVGDGLNAWVRERPRVVVRPDAGPQVLQGNDAGVGQGNGAAQGADARQEAPARFTPRQPVQPPSFASTTAFVPLIHLQTDSDQLGRPSTNPGQPIRDPLRRIPARLQTQFLLPIALWFITLIPEWESVRARAIRQRERAMRVVVGELNNASAAQGEDNEETGQRGHVLPDGLNHAAKRYYERVMRRSEGVDWEEEREAQRAMGIPDEDAGGDGDEMRMRML